MSVVLTSRQKEVLHWTRMGKSNRQIAEILGLTLHTVEFHLSRIMDRLGAANRTVAVVKALELNLLDLHQKHGEMPPAA